MFKNLLTAGALTTVLFGGIGSALAASCPSETPQPPSGSNQKWERYVVNPKNNFSNVFEQKYNGKKITWYLKFKSRDNACLYKGKSNAYYARYEGRLN
ncbi:hypothetical protein [Xenorhabdus thuongxuanensis]|uniref:Lipoprotein n=1 Tax=Xenorhabdus thuongxuanensis TaxID=1873484 RepID=A0A1Q5U7R3_9GAMM|nr:hypothetical protein [Xenorhabdus thuongxuanensis]OKP08517.1 hypothetical protein Xentx_00727 [Xenorhabdus thuongxuanensis]